MTSLRKRRQHNYRLIDGCFNKNLEINVSTSVPNKQKHSAFSQTQSFFILATSSRKEHQHDYRLIDGCFHKNLEIYVSCNFSNRQKKLVFKETQTSFFWRFTYAINISVIIGAMIAASTKTLQFISATVFQVDRRNQLSKKQMTSSRHQLNE